MSSTPVREAASISITSTWRSSAIERQWTGRKQRMGWETERTTQAGTRYGCFLPDLTGLARGLSAADLPLHYIRAPQRRGKFRVTAAMRSATAADRSVKQCGMDLFLLL